MQSTMLLSAIQRPTLPAHHAIKGILTHMALNCHEWLCIDIALIGLMEYCRHHAIPKALSAFSIPQLHAQWRYLKYWFNQPVLSDQLPYNSHHSIWWPFNSSELVNWLRPICQCCMSDDAILIKAYESAHEEYTDFENLCLEHSDTLEGTWADDVCYSTVSHWQRYYNNQVDTYQPLLVSKLGAIQQQGYPLFPTAAQVKSLTKPYKQSLMRDRHDFTCKASPKGG